MHEIGDKMAGLYYTAATASSTSSDAFFGRLTCVNVNHVSYNNYNIVDIGTSPDMTAATTSYCGYSR